MAGVTYRELVRRLAKVETRLARNLQDQVLVQPLDAEVPEFFYGWVIDSGVQEKDPPRSGSEAP